MSKVQVGVDVKFGHRKGRVVAARGANTGEEQVCIVRFFEGNNELYTKWMPFDQVEVMQEEKKEVVS